MNSDQVRIIAERCTPNVPVKICDTFYRDDVITGLQGNNSIGIELGVAGGHFSDRMVRSNKFHKFFGVDLYEDHHDTAEYKNALKLVGLHKNYVLLRMSFDEALDLFEDSFFDFIYFDGYAHTGEEGGKTFQSWYNKLKFGGIFAGDDYHDDWPLVKWAVNDMTKQLGCELHVTGRQEFTNLNRYPSWFFKKSNQNNFSISEDLLDIGEKIRSATRSAQKEISLSPKQLAEILVQVKGRNPQIAAQLKQLL